jgi:hypothetical protein
MTGVGVHGKARSGQPIKAKSREKGRRFRMEKDFVEIPQPDIPDEVRQVDLPEITETTPHPKPESPQAAKVVAGQATGEQGSGEATEPIGFRP